MFSARRRSQRAASMARDHIAATHAHTPTVMGRRRITNAGHPPPTGFAHLMALMRSIAPLGQSLPYFSR